MGVGFRFKALREQTFNRSYVPFHKFVRMRVVRGAGDMSEIIITSESQELIVAILRTIIANHLDGQAVFVKYRLHQLYDGFGGRPRHFLNDGKLAVIIDDQQICRLLPVEQLCREHVPCVR